MPTKSILQVSREDRHCQTISSTGIDFDRYLIEKYNISGPRYTSYPTALQFKDFCASDYLEAVANARAGLSDLSLYFHLPFCHSICYFCACNKIVTKEDARCAAYLTQLSHEIELQAELFEGRSVSQLHWGGGTPTFLTDDQITALSKKIRAHFDLLPDAEVSIEVDPRTVDELRIHRLRQNGFNRLSLGIQDFDDKVQAAVNRIQPIEDTWSVIKAARAAKFKSISMDLIYGLPFQTVESMHRTLAVVVDMDPDRISIYNYAHLPAKFKAQRQINEADLPLPREKLSILQLCVRQLTEAGYLYIGMDHFAKPDDDLAKAQKTRQLHRNFQGYSTHADCDLVAMGITGISQIGNSFAQNVKTLDEYRRLLALNVIPVGKGLISSEDDDIRRAVISSLICNFRLDFCEIEKRHQVSFQDYFAVELGRLRDMAEDGLIELGPNHIIVTPKGRFLIRNICMAFDRYIKTPERYSRII